ncbi:MAG TPA: NUDIX domain-containing protein [Aquaticitalea sp.]|nr:NUDIX domain-containing protein [Aquaticitalea sp.]
MDIKNLKNIKHYILSKAWATLYRIDYDYLFENGSWKQLSRETYDRGNGTGILLYNREKKTVILTKQFRMPAYHNDETDGMSIEVCAGAIDKKESALATVIREVEEEVGYRIKKAEQVFSAYSSPGALSEKMYLFVAEYADGMKVNDGGGVAAENEEIEVLELPFEKAMQMMDSGEIQDFKTIMLLQYAKLNQLV